MNGPLTVDSLRELLHTARDEAELTGDTPLYQFTSDAIMATTPNDSPADIAAFPLPSIPDALEFRREQYGWTPWKMAQELGLHKRRHYGEVICGTRQLTIKAMRAAHAMGVPADVLLQPPPKEAGTSVWNTLSGLTNPYNQVQHGESWQVASHAWDMAIIDAMRAIRDLPGVDD